ncbi:PREDICTED: E3 ubiquitin-protein ligase TRIM71-like [Amphimedon queenslandica]|nr:PREDICTED: E3 ubiquitin-protein ligase TRIM71-like [Amphimedon queenslandica]|eukprot:XP_019851931.1 PREDICTED: E3 ubiquitin-protein ligase TRIM71-like [Amphimedon queenslandica]
MDGYLIASFGEEGSGSLQFNSPSGIAISPITGYVYVADYYNNRIQVLNSDLTFYDSFGSRGSLPGQFKAPRDIAINSQGLVYVADRNNYRIQKFSPQENRPCIRYRYQFDTQAPNSVGIAIDTVATGDLVHVSEWGNHSVSVFTGDGVFVNSFGCKGGRFLENFKHPSGLAVNKINLIKMDFCIFVIIVINDSLFIK